MWRVNKCELRHPPTLASVTGYAKCSWKRSTIAAVFVCLYAISLQFSYVTIGEPYAWALNEQKRIVRQKAQEAKEKGLVVGSNVNAKKGVQKSELQINEDELPSEYLPNAWACLCLFFTIVSHLLFHLLCHWSVKFKWLATYEYSDNFSDEETFLLVLPPTAKGRGEFCQIQENDLSNNTFIFQNQKFEILEEEEAAKDDNLIGEGDNGCRLIQNQDRNAKSFYRK